jgi:hypothetical protein
VRLIKHYKPSRAAFLLLTTVLATACVVVLIVRLGEAQSCAFDPCRGDPCCGVEGCDPGQLACEAAGWFWNFSSSVCSDPPANATECDDLGMFWNFSGNFCQDDPPTQIVCEGVTAYWNYTTSVCINQPAIGMCGGGADWGNYFSTGCRTGLGLFGGSFCDRSSQFKTKCFQYDGDYDSNYCVCTGCGSCGGSPILVDVPGGFDLTDVDHGVSFDLNGNGTRDRVSWTSPTSSAAWLVLDRNRDGGINSGKELFGDYTFQTESATGAEKNGFLALAEWDKPENGGNGDSAITQSDYVFAKLRLWRDANQNGNSDPGELHGLWEYGIRTISLDYREARRRDKYGNEFRYRAKVHGADDTKLSRWAYDVYLKGTQ